MNDNREDLRRMLANKDEMVEGQDATMQGYEWVRQNKN